LVDAAIVPTSRGIVVVADNFSPVQNAANPACRRLRPLYRMPCSRQWASVCARGDDA
jgi:hypothetical protein